METDGQHARKDQNDHTCDAVAQSALIINEIADGVVVKPVEESQYADVMVTSPLLCSCLCDGVVDAASWFSESFVSSRAHGSLAGKCDNFNSRLKLATTAKHGQRPKRTVKTFTVREARRGTRKQRVFLWKREHSRVLEAPQFSLQNKHFKPRPRL